MDDGLKNSTSSELFGALPSYEVSLHWMEMWLTEVVHKKLVPIQNIRSERPQQKNIELETLSFNLGSWGTGKAPGAVIPPWLEDVSEACSNFMNVPNCAAAKCA